MNVQALSLQTPSQCACKHFWLVIIASLFSINLSLISHIALAQTIESLKFGKVLNSVSFG